MVTGFFFKDVSSATFSAVNESVFAIFVFFFRRSLYNRSIDFFLCPPLCDRLLLPRAGKNNALIVLVVDCTQMRLLLSNESKNL